MQLPARRLLGIHDILQLASQNTRRSAQHAGTRDLSAQTRTAGRWDAKPQNQAHTHANIKRLRCAHRRKEVRNGCAEKQRSPRCTCDVLMALFKFSGFCSPQQAQGAGLARARMVFVRRNPGPRRAKFHSSKHCRQGQRRALKHGSHISTRKTRTATPGIERQRQNLNISIPNLALVRCFVTIVGSSLLLWSSLCGRTARRTQLTSRRSSAQARCHLYSPSHPLSPPSTLSLLLSKPRFAQKQICA